MVLLASCSIPPCIVLLIGLGKRDHLLIDCCVCSSSAGPGDVPWTVVTLLLGHVAVCTTIASIFSHSYLSLVNFLSPLSSLATVVGFD